MPITEDQDLRIRVVLDDQASAGLAALKKNIGELSSGTTRASLETFKRSQIEIGEQMKKITELAIGGEKAMVSYIGKFGALGLAIGALGNVITSTSSKLADLASKAETIGVPAANFKNLVDQMVLAGVKSDVAVQSVQGFTSALVELGRVGSQRYVDLVNHAGAYGEAMARELAGLQQRGEIEEAYNKAQEMAALIQKNRYDELIKRGEGEQQALRDANALANEFLRTLNLDPSTKQLDHVERLSAAQKKASDDAIAAAKKVNEVMLELSQTSEDIAGKLITAFGPNFSKMLQQDIDDIEAFTKLIEKLVGLIPAPTEAKKNIQDKFKQFQKDMGVEDLPPVNPLSTGMPQPAFDWNQARRSENIEDRRDEDERDKLVRENTEQLKRLNDFYALLEQGDIGAGGGRPPPPPPTLPGPPGGGGDAPYGSRVGPGNASVTPDGLAPHGSRVGPGTASALPGPAAKAFDQFTRAAAVKGALGGGAFDPFTQQAATSGVHSSLAASRADIMAELKQFQKDMGVEDLPPVNPLGTGMPQSAFDWNQARRSENIEDRRDEDERDKLVRENTEQLKRLNDFYALLEQGDIGAGGGGRPPPPPPTLPGPPGGGGDAPYGSRVGPGNASVTPDGLAPHGSRVGPGTASALPGPAAKAFDQFTRAAAVKGSLGHSAFDPLTREIATTGAHGSIAADRAAIMSELNDPATRQLTMQMMATEGGAGHGQAALEAAVNRVAMIRQKVPGWTLAKELRSGFYGPINRGEAQRRQISQREQERYNEIFGRVAAGSDLIQGRTDQGMIGDPNARGPGRVAVGGSSEIYNYWKGSRGGVGFTHEDSRRFAEQMEAAAGDRNAIDRHMIHTVRVEGSGTLTANVNAPRGTDVTLGGTGLFKKTEMNRSIQMEPARTGPTTTVTAE